MINLKKRLKSHQATIGTWMSLGNEGIAEIFTNAGFEWIVIDLEHSATSIRETERLIRVIELGGSIPLVRLAENCPVLIKRVMDAGAHGIIVPMVNSREEAECAVAACHYPPLGTRGVGLSRAQQYGAGFAEYHKWQEKGPVVIVQIEDVKAMENLDEIFSVRGVDAYMIGPYDFSCSMGMAGEFNNPAFRKNLQIIKKCAKKQDLPAGIHLVEPDTGKLRKLVKEGYGFIAYSVDFRMIDVVSRKALNDISIKP